jgi:hypothetical protein
MTHEEECDLVLRYIDDLGGFGNLKHLEVLGLARSTVIRCLEDLDHLGRIEWLPHRTSRSDAGVDHGLARITDRGREVVENPDQW